jgi:hypothetical protein
MNWQENDAIINKIMKEELLGKIHFILKNNEISAYLLTRIGIEPQIRFNKPQATIYFIERRTKDSNYFFIRHSKNKPIKFSIEIKKEQLIPESIPFELNPWTGNIVQLPQYQVSATSIQMDLWFEAYGSTIIEFKKSSEMEHLTISPVKPFRIKSDEILTLINKPGTYNFITNTNKKQEIIINNEDIPKPIRLQDWDFYARIRQIDGSFLEFKTQIQDNTDWRSIKALKYCSNKGYYSTKINLDSKYVNPNLELILDLKRVGDVAEIEVNDFKLHPLMCYPYETNISPYVHEGENRIKIIVTPTLRNQLVGYAKKDKNNYRNHKRRKLMASGLLDVCEIRPCKKVRIL